MKTTLFHDDTPCRLLPAEAFDDGIAGADLADLPPGGGNRRGVGPDGDALHFVINSRMCGYSRAPTAKEIYDGFRSAEPTESEASAVRSWMMESDFAEKRRAWIEQAYSWRMLARAVHRYGIMAYRERRLLNTYATRIEPVESGIYPMGWTP